MRFFLTSRRRQRSSFFSTISLLSLSFALSVQSAWASTKCNSILSEKDQKTKAALVKVDPKTFEFSGLTEEGIAVLRSARDILRERNRIFENDLKSMSAIHHAGTVARLFKGHMFLYGPPGGAKSAFVNWMMKGESEAPFKLQLHQMTSEQAFVGGQNFEAAKQGRFEVVTEGSLADYAVALIDESEKGNPAALATLLSLLNERQVLAGNKIIKARLETLFATSNASLPEFFEQFFLNGQGTTAPALLNRFHFKAFVYNWLSLKDQADLDLRNERKRYLEAISKDYPESLQDEVFLNPGVLEWENLRQIAHSFIEPSALFQNFYREFVDEMRSLTYRAIRESEERHKNNHLDEPFVYFPSADYTERLRQQIPDIVLMSAFVSFLESPLADDANLALSTRQKISLDPLSIWRAYLVMTTIGPGRVQLKFDSNSEQKLDIHFDWLVDATAARDRHEELLIQNLRLEQERFRSTFLKHLNQLNSHIEIRSIHSSKDSRLDAEEQSSFELLLLNASE